MLGVVFVVALPSCCVVVFVVVVVVVVVIVVVVSCYLAGVSKPKHDQNVFETIKPGQASSFGCLKAEILERGIRFDKKTAIFTKKNGQSFLPLNGRFFKKIERPCRGFLPSDLKTTTLVDVLRPKPV